MVICNKGKSSRHLWCTFVIATIATCGAFVYINFTTEAKQNSSFRSSKDYSTSPEKLTEENCISMCDSKECVYRSKLLLDYVKPDVNPCENFHQFACGKFLENNVAEEGSNYIAQYTKMLKAKLKSVLDTIEADPESASGKMMTVYNSCLKYSSSDFQALPTILQFLRSLGIPDWPNLDQEFKFVDTSLIRVIGNFLAYQEYGFVDFSTKYEYVELHDPNLLVNASLSDAKSVYESHEKPVRKNLVDRVLNYFNLDPETIDGTWKELEAVLCAITRLKEQSKRIHAENEDSTESLLNCTQEAENEWTDLCETLETLIEISDANDKVSRNYAPIQKHAVYFMQNVFPVLKNFTDRSIANFLAFNVLLNNMNELNFYFRLTRERTFSADLHNKYESSNRWQTCVEWISEHMTLALGHEYVKKSFTVPMIQEVQDLAAEGIRETADLMSHQEWMSEDLRKQLKEEVGNITTRFEEHMATLPNETIINAFYEEFHPTEGNFLHNVLEYKKCFKGLEMRGVVTIEHTSWFENLFVPTAAGGGSGIDIQFGLLFPPTYMPGLQRFLNLISLGMVIIHEVGHNFNSIFGYHSGANTEAVNYFGEKLKCLEDQYSQFRFETIGKNLKGDQVRNENFADTVAVSVLDKLIEKYASDDTSLLLPSVSLPVKQLMYISGLQMWCSSHTKNNDELLYNFSTHSPSRFRILGMMQNSKGFSEAFGCLNGSYMNPFPKCVLLE